MAVVTIYRLAEECLKIINSGDIPAASPTSINEVKIAIGQVINQLLKVDYYQVNVNQRELIPNGAVMGLYEDITVTSYGTGKSRASLPIKPLKLPRNLGVFAVYLTDYPDNEFIPLQMGQANLIKSQPMINELLGQIGYEVFGMQVQFTKDLPLLYPGKTISMRLAIMDINEYDDYTPLPIIPEMEFEVKRQVVALYKGDGIADKLVDSTTKTQQNIPVTQQKQS
jgi:hypothetical protein